MKKYICILLLSFTVCLLTGCVGENIALTEDELDSIAQYSAYLLMKYDKNYTVEEKLLDVKELKDAIKERQEEVAMLNSTPSPEPTPQSEPAEEPEPSPQNDSGEDIPVTPTAVPTPIPFVTLSECFGSSDFDIKLCSFEIKEEYLNENEYYSISAPKDKEIVVLDFEITNLSGEKSVFNGADYPVKYQLICDGQSSLEPKVSLILNDIQFLKEEIEASGSCRAILIFFTDKTSKSLVFRAINDTLVHETIIK